MRRLTDRLYPWWNARTVREQRMLMVMALLAAAVFVWLGVVRPAWGWREDAAERRARAELDLAEVRAGLRLMAPTSAVPRAVVDLEGFEPLVLRTAEAAGLSVTTGMAASGQLGVRIPNASSAALFGWLSALERAHGIEVVSLGVIENTDATLQVEGALARQAG
jgi:general secretion pathway protein M